MSALGLALGIGIQNIREGSALSLPLRVEGRSRKSAFYYGAMSAIVESIAAVLGAYAVMSMTQLLPYALLFAAGAMLQWKNLCQVLKSTRIPILRQVGLWPDF